MLFIALFLIIITLIPLIIATIINLIVLTSSIRSWTTVNVLLLMIWGVIITYIFSKVLTELLVILETFFGIIKWSFSLVAILQLLLSLLVHTIGINLCTVLWFCLELIWWLSVHLLVIMATILLVVEWAFSWIVVMLRRSCSEFVIIWYILLHIRMLFPDIFIYASNILLVANITADIAIMILILIIPCWWFTVSSFTHHAHLVNHSVSNFQHILPYYFHIFIFTFRSEQTVFHTD